MTSEIRVTARGVSLSTENNNGEATPLVSVLVPVKNEERYIAHALDSLLSSDIGSANIEILIAEGHSNDRTRNIVESYIKKYNSESHEIIRLLNNPSGNTAIGRNICIENAKAPFLLNFSGHAMTETKTIRILHEKLANMNSEVIAVGCSNFAPPHDNESTTFVARIVDLVFSSVLGGASATSQFFQVNRDTPVSSVAFTLYKKEAFENVGLFDPDLLCGEDGELNLRIGKAGFQLLLTPDTKVYLYRRSSLIKFAKQMYRYGIGGAKRMKKHPWSFSLFQIIPPLFALYVVTGSIFSILYSEANGWLGYAFASSFVAYIIVSWLSSLLISRNLSLVVFSPIFYFIEHLFYGFGFIRGLLPHRW